MMKDDFRAKRWPRQLLAGLMLIVIACVSQECLDMRDPELVAQAEKMERLTEEAYPGSEREKGHIRRETLSAEETQIFDMFDKLGEQDKPVPVSLDKRLDAIHTEQSEWKNWWEGKTTPVPAGTMKPPPMQAQATDIPPALYVDEPSESIFFIGNTSNVENGATTPSTFTYTPHNDKHCKLEKITTYHWNYGKGVTPGTISLVARDGTVYGPWQAHGEEGQGGVPNAYWVVNVDITLRGNDTYTVIDSDPGTWSQNKATNGMGMTWGDGRCSSDESGF